MIVHIDSRFEKDTDKINNKNLLEKIAHTIEEVRIVAGVVIFIRFLNRKDIYKYFP